MTNIGTIRDRANLFRDGLLTGNLPTEFRYFADITVGSPTGNFELFINGVNGQRIYLPDNCVIAGRVTASGWEVDQVTPADHLAGEFTFQARRVAGTITLNSTSTSTTNGTLDIQTDVPNSALAMIYMPPLNSRTIMVAVLNYSFSALDLSPSNFYSISG